MNQKDPNAKEGMRIRMVSMIDDPNPIQNGEEGTIRLVDGMGVIHVNWDNGRTLGVIPGADQYILEPALENVFDNLNYDLNEGSTTKLSSTTKSGISSAGIKTGQVSNSFKKANIKSVKTETTEIEFSKKFENKPKGVVKEKESVKNLKKKNVKTEMTGGGAMGGTNTVSAWGGQGAGITPPITGNGKPTWGEGPLTSKGVAKAGPLVKKKKKKIVKEVTMTHYKVDGNIVRKDHEDTRHDAWASDKNGDGWNFNDDAFYENGEIVEPLAKISTTWDEGKLDVSKEWDKTQSKKGVVTKKSDLFKGEKSSKGIKKEDVLRMVKTRIDESKKGIKVDLEKGDDILTGKFKNHKDKVKRIGKDDKNQPTVNDKPMLKFRIPKLTPKKAKAKEKIKEEPIEEMDSSSVWGVNGPPVGPAFAAKKGEWKMVKRPIWKGGTIIQKDDNEGILNPISEANTVKSKGNKYVTIAKKCKEFPYCSQGAIDKPLKISKTVKGSGTYVEEEVKLTTETIKNIHEVALETGKTFDEVYKLIKNNVQI